MNRDYTHSVERSDPERKKGWSLHAADANRANIAPGMSTIAIQLRQIRVPGLTHAACNHSVFLPQLRNHTYDTYLAQNLHADV